MKIQQFLDPVLIIGTLVSVVISLALFAANIEAIPSITFGLLGIIISLLIDLTARIAQQEAKFLDTLHLSQSLFKDANFQAYITDVVDAWDTLSSSSPHPLLAQQAEIEIQEVRNRLVEIASGEVRTDASDVRPRSTVIREAKSSIQVISMISVQWWKSDVGENYWELNIEALERGVKITRIFVGNDIDAGRKDLMTRMHKAGVQVLFVKESDIPEELCEVTVISDNSLVWTTKLDHDRVLEREHHFSSKPEDVTRAAERFAKLKEYAVDFTKLFPDEYKARKAADRTQSTSPFTSL